MTVLTKRIEIEIGADSEMENITELAQTVLGNSDLTEGHITLFIPGATGTVSTVEYEPGLQKDVPAALERIAPKDLDYEHHKTWGDDNGRSHVRATLMGPGMVVPFTDGEMILGRWQQIVAINHDTRPRKREVVVQLMGE